MRGMTVQNDRCKLRGGCKKKTAIATAVKDAAAEGKADAMDGSRDAGGRNGQKFEG